MQFINEQTSIPYVTTRFSAPNYYDKGPCLKFDDELLNIRNLILIFCGCIQAHEDDRVLKENQNNIIQLKQLSHRQLPTSILQAAIEKVLLSFNEVKRADKENNESFTRPKGYQSIMIFSNFLFFGFV
ncbi:hypothetical protein RFI_31082 [Reticulomyxa filosa]|uniref:Uncharacterized protein n=1 Tax=Reticulomyxa filosa TaxID=46433 RepID=X6LXG3_RETFI|nr:hypothetical protein RFI_31082 [Reticulomyxa filosa]|eukprot:ETO06314.1 hypothetical protein RFI_31082 [Reticulomyxa filosa]